MKPFWTDEKIKWLIESKKIYDDREDILNAFNNHFNTNVSYRALKVVNSKKKLCLPKSSRLVSNGMNNLKKGWVKLRGFESKNIGDEINFSRKEKPYIKVSNEKNGYILKHRYLYEQYHNVKLDAIKDVIIFLDNDYTNFSKDNLYRTTQNILGYMTGHDLNNNKSMQKITYIKFCEWKEKIKGS